MEFSTVFIKITLAMEQRVAHGNLFQSH